MRGGTYLVARRIRMLIESWDTDYLADQENVFGRFKTSGAPLTGTHEFDTVDLGTQHARTSPSSRSTPTSGSPAPAPTAARRSCAAATRTPTVSTPDHRPARRRTVFYQRTSRIRARSSCRSSHSSASGTTSTSTSATPAARSSPSRRACRGPATGGEKLSSPSGPGRQRSHRSRPQITWQNRALLPGGGATLQANGPHSRSSANNQPRDCSSDSALGCVTSSTRRWRSTSKPSPRWPRKAAR